MKYNTLDIDHNNKEQITKIYNKIIKCRNLTEIDIEFSELKGVHIKLWCNQNCEICRIVFDDETRFHYDQYRPEYSQNVMFDTKEQLKELGVKDDN